MTDNEIIKAMQCVIGNDANCSECTYQKVLPFPSCRMMCAKNALDLINRQKIESNKYRNRVQSQKGEITRLHKKVAELTAEMEEQKAEIERLTDLSDRLGNDIDIKLNYIYDLEEKIETVKSEVIKEFAERLKCGVPQETGVIRCADVDNLVKEMTEVETNRRKEDEGNG